MIIKTQLDKVSDIIKTVKNIHPYSVPEVISLPIIAGNSDYIK